LSSAARLKPDRTPEGVLEGFVERHVLAYNLTRVMNIIGVQPLMAAMRA
jgi:hypothetical protein